jgi:hypothetical protein
MRDDDEPATASRHFLDARRLASRFLDAIEARISGRF